MKDFLNLISYFNLNYYYKNKAKFLTEYNEGKKVRALIASILGHIDHGKTSLLDYVRGTVVQKREAAGITQHIGASYFPVEAIKNFCGAKFAKLDIFLPGILIVDTPGHAAFMNLRKRGGAVADIAILVIDIMDGPMPITWESVNILREKKVPFIIAANKIDRIPSWKPNKNADFVETYNKQSEFVQKNFDEKLYKIIGDFLEEGFPGCDRYDKIKDFTKSLAIVPTSAITGEGISSLLIVLLGLAQQFLKDKLLYSEGPAKGVVLEVKKEAGYGFTIDTLIYDGIIKKGQKMVVGGLEKPIVTKIRALFQPKPLDEIRDPRQKFDSVNEIHASAGIKILASDLEGTVAGAPLYVIENDSKEEEIYKLVEEEVNSIRIQTDKAGIVLKADTLGSLEALEKHLSENGISISRADVGSIKKADILGAVVVRDFDLYSSVVLGFNVNILDEAKEMAYNENVRIFTNDVIYRLTEDYIEYKETRKAEDTAKELGELVLPGKLQMMPEFIFRNSNPAVFGVRVIGGDLISKVPIIKNNGKYIGRINKVQDKGQNIQKATKDMEVAVSMKGVEIGRDLEKDEILYINVPESHVRQLIGKFLDELTSEQKDILREYIILMRKEKNPWWGM